MTPAFVPGTGNRRLVSLSERPAKRVKRHGPETSTNVFKEPKQDKPSDRITSFFCSSYDASPEPANGAVSDSEAEPESDFKGSSICSELVQHTGLEQASAHVRTDKEAIAEYETLRSSAINVPSGLHERLDRRDWVRGKSSIYVDAFNLALETVLSEESQLFNSAEIAVFNSWRALGYEAQYLYVRLFLRKSSAWHRVGKLGYYGDIGDVNAAVKELFSKRQLPLPDEFLKANAEANLFDELAADDSFAFADDSEDHIDSLEEAYSLLMVDELKTLARHAKVHGKNKPELVRVLISSGETQASLESVGLKRLDVDESSSRRQSSIDYSEQLGRTSSMDSHKSYILGRIMSETGKCIRLSAPSRKLFERVHLVFYRSTEWTEKSLITMILSHIQKRNFPEYIVSRSSTIFESRAILLEFENALRMQRRVDDILEFHGVPTLKSLQTILQIFDDIHPRWRIFLEEEERKEKCTYNSGEGAYLRRLSPGWVYTRIVSKAASVLGMGQIRDHAREHSVLIQLLSQRLFHASRRGGWYQRKALLEERYLATLFPDEGRTVEDQAKHWKRIALKTCEQGLEDNLVHIIYHYDLQKRTIRLEKALKIPRRLQHDFGHIRLAKPVERTFEGIRVEQYTPAAMPKTGFSKGASYNKRISDGNSSVTSASRGTKTIWLDPSPHANPDSMVSVEAMCLSHYRSLGWKGYHSEGGILRTLFAALFYDILFTYMPNVFQTPYQTCPLDLHTDSFFPSRMSEINRRLADIANGQGRAILTEVWERECQKRPCVVGLDWDFGLDDLKDIVHCFGGEKLATVCKIMAQEYAERTGGMPDLFLWRNSGDFKAGEVLFAEIKSENDRLSDTQRLWIHVLTSAGIQVELCNAVARELRVL